MVDPLKQRSEIVFLYDITDANPNGDPLNENRPRIDEETEINIVTDVRLKRTIRDYLNDFRGENIFIKEEKTETGEQKTRTRRLGEFLCNNSKRFKKWDVTLDKLEDMEDKDIHAAIKNKITLPELEQALLEFYTDLRLFGATIAVKESTITKIGPVQFKFGRSLHKVESQFIKGTTVMPSREGVTAGTITEMHILPYSLISFYGVANENAAQSTGLTEKDMALLMDGIWNGTKNLITRSKFGQIPRLLLRIEYKENNFHIGDLDKDISLKTKVPDKEIRSIKEVILNLSSLFKRLENHHSKIAQVHYLVDEETDFEIEGKTVLGRDLQAAFPDKLEVVPIDIKTK